MSDNNRTRLGSGPLVHQNEIPVFDPLTSDFGHVHRLAMDPQEKKLRGLRCEILNGELKPAVIVLLGEVETASGDTSKDRDRLCLRTSRGASEDLDASGAGGAPDKAVVFQFLEIAEDRAAGAHSEGLAEFLDGWRPPVLDRITLKRDEDLIGMVGALSSHTLSHEAMDKDHLHGP